MKTLLIIEDDPYVRRLYRRLFLKQGFDFIMAEDGRGGLEKAKSLKPGLILLDILMTPLSGLQVLKKLKSDPDTSAIPVIMLTNVGDETVIAQAKREGAQGFIIKAQQSPEEILALVESVLAS